MSFERYVTKFNSTTSMGINHVGISKSGIRVSRILLEKMGIKTDGSHLVSLSFDRENQQIRLEFPKDNRWDGALRMIVKDGGGNLPAKGFMSYFKIDVTNRFHAPVTEIGDDFIIVSLSK